MEYYRIHWNAGLDALIDSTYLPQMEFYQKVCCFPYPFELSSHIHPTPRRAHQPTYFCSWEYSKCICDVSS